MRQRRGHHSAAASSLLILLFLSSSFLSSPLAALNGETIGTHLRWFVTDPYKLFFKTRGGYPASLGLTFGVSGLLMLPEDHVQQNISDIYDDCTGNPFVYANNLGDDGLIAIAGTLYGISLFADNRKLQDALFTSIQSVAYAQAITNSLKYFVGRIRPGDIGRDVPDRQLQFEPRSGNNAYPSGHSTIAFATLTPLFMYYPHWSTALLFVGATGTTIARMGMDRHWSTDVLAGAGIGFFTGYFLSRLHQSERAGDTFRIFPTAGKESLGVTMSWSY